MTLQPLRVCAARLPKRAILITAVTLVLAGCSLAPTLQTLEAPIPSAWPQGEQSAGDVKQGLAELVVDEELRRVLELAIDNNRDLRIAMLNVQEARARYGIQRSEQLPSLNGEASAGRERLTGEDSATGRSEVRSDYRGGIVAPAFEIDLFGRLSSLSTSAFEDYLAEEQNAESARLTLVSEVLRTYLRKQGALQRLDVTIRTRDARKKTLELIAYRRSVGHATALEYEDTKGLAELAEADLEQVKRELAQTDNALRLLTGTVALPGMPVSSLREGHLLVQGISAGAPSELISYRPDILAAEHLLRARNADIGAARAAFFPRISLTGSLGSSSPELSDLFSSASSVWSFMPTLSLPIFAGGRNMANLDLAKVRKDIAIARYGGVIQLAFREVADALAANDTLRREVVHRKALLDSSQRTLMLAQTRYQSGLDSSLRYLDAQRSAYAYEVAYIEAATQQQLSFVETFRALGGRWYLQPSNEKVASNAAE